MAWLGEAYRSATAAIDEAEASDPAEADRIKAEIREVLRAMEAGDEEISAQYRETRQWCLDGFADIYERMGVTFDVAFYESEVDAPGQAVVDEFLDRGVFVASQGAVICDLEDEGLGACLVRKSDGASLYMTWDLALAREKFERFDIERSLYVVASEQRHHFRQLFATLGRMGYERAKDCRHVSYELVMLPTGKMSSRRGTVVPLHVLRDTLQTTIRAKMEAEPHEARAAWDEARWQETVETVAQACLVYGMLSTSNNRTVVFDVDAWTQPEGDTGAYILYALARIGGIARKAGDLLPGLAAGVPPAAEFGHETERALINHLVTYPDVVARVERDFEPSLLANYLFEGTKRFARFYNQCPVLKAEGSLRHARLQLVAATDRVLRQACDLLALPTLDAM